MSRESRHIGIASPYREGSILAIARAAERRGELDAFFTTIHTATILARLSRLPLPALGPRLARELGRRSYTGISVDRVQTTGSVWELLTAGARRLPRAEPLASRMMYTGKGRFDQEVAARLNPSWDRIVAMAGSSATTLAAARRFGARTVLNFVNSHPAYQNRYLRELAGLRSGHHELVSPAVAHRAEQELEQADLVLVPSRFVARQLAEVGLPDSRVAVEPYGVDLSAFHPAPQARKKPARLRCLYVGQMSYRKGVPVLLQAARCLRRLPLDFVLLGPLTSPGVLRDLPENARVLRPTVHGGVAEAMRGADIFVLPSIEDAYPLVTLEAMASGLPVIVSDHAGTSELIADGSNGLLAPAGDVGALACAIERLHDDPGLRHRLGAAARRSVEAGHSWDAYGDRVLDLIERQHVACEG
jgi:glycosyltransferase involved in cell wall biosynthesis